MVSNVTYQFLKPVTIIKVPQVKALALDTTLTIEEVDISIELDDKQLTIDSCTKEVILKICKP